MSKNTQLSIGQVAKAADVNVETIRYYQRRGLLTEPAKRLADTVAIQPKMPKSYDSSNVRRCWALR